MLERIGAAPPLAGVRVIDVTRIVARSFDTQMLADRGAEVATLVEESA